MDVKIIKNEGSRFALKAMRAPFSNYNKSTLNGDMDLSRRLTSSGPSHRKHLRFINMYLEISAPLYWWKEFETYKVGSVSLSESTMHTIHKTPFSIDMFEHNIINKPILKLVIDKLEYFRNKFLESKDPKYWKAMIQALPSSYIQKRFIMVNYETVLNIIDQRSGHRLSEWDTFIQVIKSNSLFKELTGIGRIKK